MWIPANRIARKGPTNHSREFRAVANPGRASHKFLDLSLHKILLESDPKSEIPLIHCFVELI